MADVRLIAGTDEAGRGPLAGAVFAGAVLLDPERPIEGLNDSKKLTAKRRDSLFAQIRQRSICWTVSAATVQEIDALNILHASMLAMKRAVSALRPTPDFVYVDGNRVPDWSFESEALVGGDGRVAAVSAASIVAKVCRDRYMNRMAQAFPGYGFERHAGYPTAFHLQALRERGPCAIHRKSYAPVKQADLFAQAAQSTATQE